MEVIKNTIKTALISVFDKTNIIEFAQELIKNNIIIYATNNTQRFLIENNIIVKNVQELTQYPEILNGKIKTIHPKIFGGILGNHDDINVIQSHNIKIIDLLVINFYPITDETINIIPNIDIGGPAMVRAAAKNYQNKSIIVNISDYKDILKKINNLGYIDNITNLKLARKAFQYTQDYDFKIFQYFYNKENQINQQNKLLPNVIYLKLKKKQDLKYGENPNQSSALYTIKNHNQNYINKFKQVHGTTLSYNNLYDAYVAFECVNQFTNPACVIVKHGNPCSASISENAHLSYISAYRNNSISAFGGVIGFNRVIDKKTVSEIINTQFVELIIGIDITPMALNVLREYKKVKVITCINYNKNNNLNLEFKNINNNVLVQELRNQNDNIKNWKIVSKRIPTEREKKYALFCWKIAKFVKSNAIVYSNAYNTVGIGAGQTNRVESVKIAHNQYINNKNTLKLINPKIIIASDAFFPFKDSIEHATNQNKDICCIIQPGGSIRDSEVIECVNDHNISMIFTQERIFKH